MFVLLTSYQVIHVRHTDVLLGYIIRHRGLYKYMSYWTLWESSADSSLFTLSPRYLTTCACLSCFCWSFCFNFFFTLAFLSFFLDTSAACDRKRKRQLVWRETETLLTISYLATTWQKEKEKNCSSNTYCVYYIYTHAWLRQMIQKSMTMCRHNLWDITYRILKISLMDLSWIWSLEETWILCLVQDDPKR